MVEVDAAWKLRGKPVTKCAQTVTEFALHSIASRKTSKCSQSQLQIYSKLLKTRCHSIGRMLSPGVVLAQVCDFYQKSFSLLMLLEQRKYKNKLSIKQLVKSGGVLQRLQLLAKQFSQKQTLFHFDDNFQFTP